MVHTTIRGLSPQAGGFPSALKQENGHGLFSLVPMYSSSVSHTFQQVLTIHLLLHIIFQSVSDFQPL